MIWKSEKKYCKYGCNSRYWL